MRVSTGALLAAASAVAYGSLAVLARVAYDVGWNVPSLLTARFLLAALTILPFALAARGSWRGFGAGFAVGAVGYAATTAFYFPSLHFLPVAVASFLLYLAPILVAVLSFALLGERLGRRGRIALGVACGGLALLASGAFTGRLSPVGVLLASASAVAYALTTVASRRLVKGAAWAPSSLAVCVGAFTTYALFALATSRLAVPPSPRGIAAVVGIGVLATGIALSLFFAALSRIGAAPTSVISTLEPVSTLILAMAFLQEYPDWTGVAGGLLIVAGAALVVSTPAGDVPATHHE